LRFSGNVAHWGNASIVLAVPFLGSGAAKLAGATTMRKSAEHIGLTYPAYRLIGVAEVAGAAGPPVIAPKRRR
jgi:DoxX-like family